jgi:hypothetical protein
MCRSRSWRWAWPPELGPRQRQLATIWATPDHWTGSSATPRRGLGPQPQVAGNRTTWAGETVYAALHACPAADFRWWSNLAHCTSNHMGRLFLGGGTQMEIYPVYIYPLGAHLHILNLHPSSNNQRLRYIIKKPSTLIHPRAQCIFAKKKLRTSVVHR